MKKQWIVLAVVTAGFSLCVLEATAQSPQGAGAAEAAQSSNTPRSYNPIKWVKRGPNTANEALDANTNQDAKLTTKLQMQGVLPAKTTLKDTCSTIKGLEECVAALHAGHNLGLDFNCLKSNLTGVQAGVDMSSCKKGTNDKPISLSHAIHALKPDVNDKAETKNAEKQARDDLKEAGL